MSSTGKYTTIYDIIERVRREGVNDFTEEEAKEWIWESVSLLGIPFHFVDKTAVLTIENARSPLPYDYCDFTEGGIREYNSKIPLIKNVNTYYNADNVGVIENPIILNSEAESIVYVDGVLTDASVFLTQVPIYINNSEDYTYRINNGYLFTGFKTGTVEMAYKAFPVDNENNPLIEDDVKVIRTVVAYIVRKIIKRMWLRDEISLQKKQVFDQEYSFAAASARSNSNLEGIDTWENIRARMNRLYRDPNLQKIGFSGFGYGEGLNINSSNIR